MLTFFSSPFSVLHGDLTFQFQMIDPVLSVCRIRSCLRCKESLLKSDAITCKADELKGPDGKLKASSDCSVSISLGTNFMVVGFMTNE